LLRNSIGLLFGDGSIQRNSSQSVEKWRMKILQGRDSHYVKELHKEFGDKVRAPVYFDEKRKTYSFFTLFLTDLCPLASIFINQQGKKYIGPYSLENSISPLSLAHWFMDDGGRLSYNKDYPRRAVVLNYHASLEGECKILRDNLNKAYNFESWCKKNKRRTIVAIPARKWEDFRDLVDPHVLESMRCKFPR
jgi:hypothetical protein